MIRFSKHNLMVAIVLVIASHAVAEDKQVKAKVNGTADTLLGNLNVTVGLDSGSGKNVGKFTYDNAHIGLLDECYEMRWFQFITYDDAPAEYNGKKPIPIVDPPKGGWDYQKTDGGADDEPFYENSGTAKYAYPNYSDRHTKGKDSWTDDYPFIPTGNGEKTVWQTWLVARPKNENHLCLLLGYEWEVGTKAGNKYGQFNKWIESSAADTATMMTAMTNGGFDNAKWPIEKDCDLMCDAVPEPTSMAALGFGALAIARRSRRKK